MKAVNLLPERYRPRRPSSRQSNSSYVLLGALGLVLAGVLFYVLTLNSINDARGQIAQAKADTQRLQAEAQQLGPYGDFSKIKTQRVNAVKQLAEGRFDWERLVRELSSVLPDGVWLTSAAAADSMADAGDSAAGTGFQQGASSPASSSSASGSGGAPEAPVMTIQGCARDQDAVATTLVRLRELQDAEKVQLDHSTQPAPQSGGSGGSSASGGSGDCGTTHGQDNYSFQVDVAFSAPKAEPYAPGQVPGSLGGGQ